MQDVALVCVCVEGGGGGGGENIKLILQVLFSVLDSPHRWVPSTLCEPGDFDSNSWLIHQCRLLRVCVCVSVCVCVCVCVYYNRHVRDVNSRKINTIEKVKMKLNITHTRTHTHTHTARPPSQRIIPPPHTHTPTHH